MDPVTPLPSAQCHRLCWEAAGGRYMVLPSRCWVDQMSFQSFPKSSGANAGGREEEWGGGKEVGGLFINCI